MGPGARAGVAADDGTRFRLVFEHGPVGQVFSELDGTVSEVNPAFASMLGYTPEEMVGCPSLQFIPVSGHDEVRATTAALRERPGECLQATRRLLRHRDGHTVPMSMTSSLLYDADGSPRWWVSLAVDLTDEEKARGELELAHADAVAAADRMALLHSVAGWANEARSAEEVLPLVVRTVCEHFDWPAGFVVRTGADGVPHAEHVFGDAAALDARSLRRGAPQAGERVSVRPALGGGGIVTVALPSGDQSDALLVFRAPGATIAPATRDVLDLVAIHGGRVVERESVERQRRAIEGRFRSVFDASPLPMGLSTGDTGRYSAVNGAMCELLGRPADELIGHPAGDFLHPDDIALADPAGAAAAAAPDGRHRTEMRLLHASGRVITANVTLAWIDGADGTRQLLAQIEDITARRQAERDLQWQADHDALTGLANRVRLTTELSGLGRSGARCSLLFVDIDGFKQVNDMHGHDVGDQVLVEVARRLRGVVRPTDVVARFGGDEFVVVLREDTAAASAIVEQVADRIVATIGDEVSTTAGGATVTVSIGVARGRVDPARPLELLRRADVALYTAKTSGRDRTVRYDARLHRATTEREQTAASLREALRSDRFVLHYQPIVRLEDSTVVGYEALVRMRAESGQLRYPGDFIEIAEQTGLVVPLGTWVLRESCRTLARLRAETGLPLWVSVNVAAQQAARGDLGELVLGALAESGLPADALTLELTESSLLEAEEATLCQLVWLRSRGVGIALDDFGTGYSSLTYLRRLPVSCLKIDRTFVADMLATPAGHAIVRAVATLASDLDLNWVAEGIETSEQAAAVRSLGPGFGQGYLYGRPAEVPEQRRHTAAS